MKISNKIKPIPKRVAINLYEKVLVLSISESNFNNNNERVEIFKQNVTQYSSNIFAEGKRFFQSVFTKLDSEIESTRTFSYKFIAINLYEKVLVLSISESNFVNTDWKNRLPSAKILLEY